MERRKISIELIETNEGQIEGVPSNPRFIKDLEFEKLKQSIIDFPEMLQIREVVVYPLHDRFIALGGNMRFRACKELGYKEIDCVILPADMPAEKLKEFAIKDNGNFGAWDFDMLANEWDLELLDMANVKVPNFDIQDFSDKNKEINTDSFDSTMFLKLIFSENEYTFVKEKLGKLADTPEKAILNLLKYES